MLVCCLGLQFDTEHSRQNISPWDHTVSIQIQCRENVNPNRTRDDFDPINAAVSGPITGEVSVGSKQASRNKETKSRPEAQNLPRFGSTFCSGSCPESDGVSTPASRDWTTAPHAHTWRPVSCWHYETTPCVRLTRQQWNLLPGNHFRFHGVRLLLTSP
jgi:hypothetical protein